MEIHINIVRQGGEKIRTFYLVIGILGLSYILLSFIVPDFKLSNDYLIWIAFLPGFFEAIVYRLSKKKIVAEHLPYLKVNEEMIEVNKGIFSRKPDINHWANIKSINLKLYEIQLTTTDGIQKTIDLSNLSDTNLKIVKDYILTIKKNRGL